MSVAISKFRQRLVFTLTIACTIFAALIMSGSYLAANHIGDVIAEAGISNFTNITISKPTGNYTNGTALGTEDPRQIIQPKPTGNYTNGTALGTEGPRQIITGRPDMGQAAPQNQPGLNIPNAITGNNVINIPNINITKEQAAKAEQDANIMIKAYYEKLEQEKQKEREEAAARAAAARSNQTMENSNQAEGSQEDAAAALADEIDTDVEDEEGEEGAAEADSEDDSEGIDNEEEDDD